MRVQYFIVFVLKLVVVSTALSKKCDKGWQKGDNRCFRAFSQARYTFSEATNICLTEQSSLATMETELDKLRLVRLVLLSSQRFAWIGIQRNTETRTLEWQANKNEVKGHASSFTSTRCYATLTGSGVLRPQPCTTRARAMALCEKEATCDNTIGDCEAKSVFDDITTMSTSSTAAAIKVTTPLPTMRASKVKTSTPTTSTATTKSTGGTDVRFSDITTTEVTKHHQTTADSLLQKSEQVLHYSPFTPVNSSSTIINEGMENTTTTSWSYDSSTSYQVSNSTPRLEASTVNGFSKTPVLKNSAVQEIDTTRGTRWEDVTENTTDGEVNSEVTDESPVIPMAAGISGLACLGAIGSAGIIAIKKLKSSRASVDNSDKV